MSMTRPLGDGQASGGEDGAAGSFVHRECGGPRAGMRVGDVEPVEHTLNYAVLAKAAVQRVEHRIGFWRECGDNGTQIRADFDRSHIIAGFPQGGDDLGAAGEADFAFGGDTAIENRDALHATISARKATACRCA